MRSDTLPRRQPPSRTALLRRILMGIALILLSEPVRAQTCRPLQVRDAAGNYIVPGVKGDIPYSSDLALDAYVQGDAARRPSVVVIHGGGLTAGSRIGHGGQLLEALTPHYDFVILDTAPALVTADVLALSRLVDKVVFVVRWGHTRQDAVVEALKQIIDAQGDGAGCVLSRVVSKEYPRYGHRDPFYEYSRPIKATYG